ncbi:hypothetical protein K402DRAFT_326191 [Aulographum hederae CBS 113979]|uniref:Uncharacterized protein n=1 Tax=Aulographum hederae CBS 113979 TaxID=1176131 RepID=A0A6G1H9B3_9PEZI|nr:hypothetical protein K402DRAFT_326191 [Aulographum hederae CBS 113979]
MPSKASSPAPHATLMIPTREEFEAIAAKQDAKEKERREARSADQKEEEEEAAAQLIQKNYRGYRERRQLEGMSLDPSTRWLEV